MQLRFLVTAFFCIICNVYEGILAQSTEAFLQLAQDHHIKSRIDSALFYYEKAVLQAYHDDGKTESLHLAVDIADIFYSNGMYENGLRILDALLEFPVDYDNEKERTALLEAFLFKAYGYEQMGDFRQAKKVYESAKLKLVNKVEYENFYVARYLYQPLGNIYTRLGELEEALKLLNRFKAISIDANENNAAAQAYNDIGIIYKSLNQYEKVIEDYEKALKLPDLNPKNKGLLLSNLATAYYETAKPERALRTAKSSIAAFNQALNEGSSPDKIHAYLSLVYNTLGKTFTMLNQPGRAIDHFNQSLTLAIQAYKTTQRREIAKIHINIGYLYMSQNQAIPALEEYQQALSCVLPGFDTNNIYRNPDINQLYAENTIFEALEGKTKALEWLYKKEPANKYLVSALDCFDLITNVEAQVRQNYLNESSKLLLLEESHRRQERAINIAYQLYQRTGDLAYKEKVLQLAEGSKASILRESLKSLQIKDFANIPDSLLSYERALKTNIIMLKKRLLSEQAKGNKMDSTMAQDWSNELFRQETALKQLNETLQQRHPRYFRLRHTASDNITTDTLRKVLLDGSTQMVEYFMGDQYLFILSITNDSFEIKRFTNSDSLNQLIQNILQSIHAPKTADPKTFAAYAHKLYDLLLSPVVNNDKKNLMIIPDGRLGYLPFDLLTIRPQEKPSFRNLPYLVKSKSVSYGFSASILLENKQANGTGHHKNTFLGVAPGFKESTRFAYLPFSDKEIQSIEKEYGGRTLMGKAATKSTFKNLAHQFNILHISSHAAVVDSLPMYSWISFSDAKGTSENDYKLYLSELYAMQLNAKLAVLSACETGSGQLSRGEGIMSLARGFAYAGCNSIVTTLWPVNDASTSFIMRRFYHHLGKGQAKDEALRMAKLDYLSSDNLDEYGANPFFWAAYVPLGNMEPIAIEEHKYIYRWYIIVALAIIVLVLFYKNLNKSSFIKRFTP